MSRERWPAQTTFNRCGGRTGEDAGAPQSDTPGIAVIVDRRSREGTMVI
jgi:hypothetical protein